MDKIKNAAIYARYSSQEQKGGESIEYQLESCREYIKGEGWALSEENIFVDEAKSGTSTLHRDEFNRMISVAKLKMPPFDVLVVYSTSRFGREMEEEAVNKAYLRKQGIEVRFSSQPMPEGDGIMGHVGKLVEKLFEWVDELQSIQIGELAFQGQKQVTQKGFHGGGKSPFGYRRVRVPDPEGKTDKDGKVVEYTTYEVVPEQAAVVHRIFEQYSDGASYKKITHALNCEGVVSPGGKTWDISAVRTILHNESYRGYRVWNQTRRNKKLQKGTKTPKPREEWVIHKDAHKAIVEDELWEAVEVRRAQNRKHIENGRGNHKTTHSPHLLTGLVQCEECGANFIVNTSGRKGKPGRGYYRYSHNMNRGASVCSNNRIVRKEAIEVAVLNLLSDELLTESNVVALYEGVRTEIQGQADDTPDRLRGLEREIQRTNGAIDNLMNAIKLGGAIQELVDEIQACKEKRANLEEEKSRVKASGPPTFKTVNIEEVRTGLLDLSSTLKYATPVERKDLLAENIRKIEVPKEGRPWLEENPEGLLGAVGCFDMVTPRGVA